MHRSVGLVDSDSGGLLGAVPEGVFEREGSEAGEVSLMRKDRHTGADEEDRQGEREQGGEAPGEWVGVEDSAPERSVTLFGDRGVRGGTSSTLTSEWKIRLATALINPGMTKPTTGAGFKQ